MLSKRTIKDAIRRAIWDAKEYQPDGIVDGKSLLEAVTTPSPPCDHKYKWSGLQEKTHGITLWGTYNDYRRNWSR